MRFLSTRMHGVADYLVGLLLIVAPYLFGFANGGAEQWVPTALGIAAIVYSMLTRYEFGLFALIPMPLHLALDAMSGLLLAASPWLFDFADTVFWPHLLIGLFELVAACCTQSVVPAEPRLAAYRR